MLSTALLSCVRPSLLLGMTRKWLGAWGGGSGWRGAKQCVMSDITERKRKAENEESNILLDDTQPRLKLQQQQEQQQ